MAFRLMENLLPTTFHLWVPHTYNIIQLFLTHNVILMNEQIDVKAATSIKVTCQRSFRFSCYSAIAYNERYSYAAAMYVPAQRIIKSTLFL